MIRYTSDISNAEMKLLEAIQDVGFGELFGVTIEDEPLVTDMRLCDAQIGLLTLIRDGTRHIDVLTVHEGMPVMAEVDYKQNGFRCRKKVKFPTTKKEG